MVMNNADKNFCMNGLVASDRTPHPGLNAVKKEQQPVTVELVDATAQQVRLTNWLDFLPLDAELEGRWALYADDTELTVKQKPVAGPAVGPALIESSSSRTLRSLTPA